MQWVITGDANGRAFLAYWSNFGPPLEGFKTQPLEFDLCQTPEKTEIYNCVNVSPCALFSYTDISHSWRLVLPNIPTPEFTLPHWPLADVAVIWTVWFSNSLYNIVTWALTVKLLSAECHEISLMRRVMAWRPQATSHFLCQYRTRKVEPPDGRAVIASIPSF